MLLIRAVPKALFEYYSQNLTNTTIHLPTLKEKIEKVKVYRIRHGSSGGYQTRLSAIVKHFENKEKT